MFGKEAPDILWGLGRNLSRLGALSEKLVWDRESAIAVGGRPTSAFAAFCGQLELGWVVLGARDPQAKGALERSHRFMRSNFERGRVFANHLDFQDRLDAWTEKANRRMHRTIRAVPAERLADEQSRMRPLRARMPDVDRRQVVRVAAQPLVRVDRNDYSIDPRVVGRPVELRVSQTEMTAVVLDTGELAARHRRVFAGGLKNKATTAATCLGRCSTGTCDPAQYVPTVSAAARCRARLRSRIADKRVVALIKAGILTELGGQEDTVAGTPQGGILLPLIANVALSVLDEHSPALGRRGWRRGQRGRASGAAAVRPTA